MGAGHCPCNGVDLLTGMYVIYMERNTSHRAIPKLRPLGPLAAAGECVTHGRKARKYMMMIKKNETNGPC